MSLLDYLRWYGDVAEQVSGPTSASTDRAKPGESKFRALEDMDPLELMVASEQQRTRTNPQQGTGIWDRKPNPASFPWPKHTDGSPMAGQRGVISGVPGVEPTTGEGER